MSIEQFKKVFIESKKDDIYYTVYSGIEESKNEADKQVLELKINSNNIQTVFIDIHHIINITFVAFTNELDSLIEQIVKLYSTQHKFNDIKEQLNKYTYLNEYVVPLKNMDSIKYNNLFSDIWSDRLELFQNNIQKINFYPKKENLEYTQYLDYLIARVNETIQKLKTIYSKSKIHIFFNGYPNNAMIKAYLTKRINTNILNILEKDFLLPNKPYKFSNSDEFIHSLIDNTPPDVSYGSDIVMRLHVSLIEKYNPSIVADDAAPPIQSNKIQIVPQDYNDNKSVNIIEYLATKQLTPNCVVITDKVDDILACALIYLHKNPNFDIFITDTLDTNLLISTNQFIHYYLKKQETQLESKKNSLSDNPASIDSNQKMCVLYNIHGNDYIPHLRSIIPPKKKKDTFYIDVNHLSAITKIKNIPLEKEITHIITDLICESTSNIFNTSENPYKKTYYLEKYDTMPNQSTSTYDKRSYTFKHGEILDENGTYISSIIKLPEKSALKSILSGGVHNDKIICPSEWLVSQDYNYRDKMSEAITKEGIELQFYDVPEDITTNQYRLINIEGKDDICYPDNNEIIKILLDKKADPNVVANGYETPLSIAIDLQNVNLVELLLSKNAKKENNGRNMYVYCYEQLKDTINASPILNIDSINEGLKTKMLLKAPEIKSILPKSDLIIKFTSYLLAHQIYNNTTYFPNMWNIEQQRDIRKILNIPESDEPNIPISLLEGVDKYFDNNATINEYSKNSYDEVEDLIDILLRLKNAHKNTSDAEFGLKNEIKDEINKVKQKIKYIHTNLKKAVKKKNLFIDYRVSQAKNNVIIVKSYDDFFDKYKIHESPLIQYKGYTKLIKFHLSEESKNYTQLIYLLSNKLCSEEMLPEQYKTVLDFYEKILYKYATDFFELPHYYIDDDKSSNDYFVPNYALKQIFDIMVHVFKHIISLNFVILLTATLIKKTNRTIEGVNKLLNEEHIDDNKTFITKCFDDIPKDIIKIKTNIKSPHEKIKFADVSKVYEDIIDRLYNIQSENKLTYDEIKLKEDILEYIVAYTEIYVDGMYQFITSQLKSFLVQHKYLQILFLLKPSYD